MNIIGKQVRRIRESQNLTQEELAARCNLIGWNISRGTLAKIESQTRRIIDSEVVKLAQVLHVDVNTLFDNSYVGATLFK